MLRIHPHNQKKKGEANRLSTPEVWSTVCKQGFLSTSSDLVLFVWRDPFWQGLFHHFAKPSFGVVLKATPFHLGSRGTTRETEAMRCGFLAGPEPALGLNLA